MVLKGHGIDKPALACYFKWLACLGPTNERPL